VQVLSAFFIIRAFLVMPCFHIFYQVNNSFCRVKHGGKIGAMEIRKPTIEDISRHYDLMTDFYHIVLGESIHVGYWPDPNDPLDLPLAQECYTDLMIRRMPLQPGQRLLDVGCGTGQPVVRLAQATDGSVVGITINGIR